MDLSHTYAAPKPKSYVGVGLVVALHLAGIYALSAGLIRTPPEVPRITTLKPLPPELTPEPPQPEPLRPERPIMKDVQPIPVPVPDDPVISQDPPPLGPTVIRETGQTVPDRGATGQVPASQPAQQQGGKLPVVQTPGAVCSLMPRPELPALNWSGDAVLNVIATVRGGRVVGTEFRLTQGTLDSKTRRSLQRAAEAALAGYQCQGDATFQQDFAFRID